MVTSDFNCAAKTIYGSTDRYILTMFLLAYLFSAKGYLEVSDTKCSVETAEAMLARGRLDIPPRDGATHPGADGRNYSKYGVGLPLYYVPWVAAGHLVALITGYPAARVVAFLLSFANIPFALLTLQLFSRCLRMLGITAVVAWLLVIGLGLGTLCWRYTVYDFSEGMQSTLLLLAVYGALHQSKRGVLVGGLGCAGLILVKLVHVTLLPLFLAYLLARPGALYQRRIREALLFTLPVLVVLGLIAWLNFVRFGNPLESGYGGEARQFFPLQIWETVPKLLGSLDKGLFIFCPILVLGLFGWRSFARRHAPEAALCGMIIVANLVLAAAWHSWVGGWSWGPRLLVPALPLWLLPAAFWLDGRRSPRRFAIAGAVTLASVLLQIPGVLVKDQQIHYIKQYMLTADEQASAIADFPAAWVLLWHKLTVHREVYRTSEFRVPGDRELDLTAIWTYEGLHLWTEHVARQFNAPAIRWLPIAALLVVGYCTLKVTSRLLTEIRACQLVPALGAQSNNRPIA